MYGNGRMLVACGYMGTGLSWGFLAGKCLADLIASGHAKDLARSLWPERLRSLES
jgi:glycine/D-amino acid oxidase-like deaminating enzyme